MKGQLTTDTTIRAPAAAVWAAYRRRELVRLMDQLLGDVLGKVEEECDGGVGSIIKFEPRPGTPGLGRFFSGIGYLKEVIVEMDDEKRVKESKVLEGGPKDLGFDGFGFRFEIIENDAESSIVRSSVLYEIDDSKADLVSHLSTELLEIIADTLGKYVVEKHQSTAGN